MLSSFFQGLEHLEIILCSESENGRKKKRNEKKKINIYQ